MIDTNRFFTKLKILILFSVLSNATFGQFEKLSIRNTSSQYDLEMKNDSTSDYIRIMLCGDIMHKQELQAKYTNNNGQFSYRSWYRQIKPLFQFSDFVLGNLKSFFPGKQYQSKYENSAPDLFLGELMYTGFNVLMMGNTHALTDKPFVNEKSLYKIDALDMFRAGYYRDSTDKAENYPLVLEKDSVRLCFLQYTLDSVIKVLSDDNINFFEEEKVLNDIKKAKDTMLSDYIIAYIDWAGNEDRTAISAMLLNSGVDIIVGTGNGEAFTELELLSFSDNSLKMNIDNIGHLNAIQNGRENNKSAVVEIILQKSKKSKKVSLYDIGFIPTWTLMDKERYSVVPISNLEEKHIKNLNLNYVQYSTMKVALTDLRYDFFNKVPEIHYDYTDKIVDNVEQTSYIRKTLLKSHEKTNNRIKNEANNSYASLFGAPPPDPGKDIIPYEDDWGIYKKARKVNPAEIEPRQTTKMYGEIDEISESGIVNIKANHKHYQRKYIPPIPLEVQRRMDSIEAYRRRFIRVDSVKLFRELRKKRRKDSLRRRDSIFKASLDPNYKPKYKEILEVSKPYNAYNQQIKSGVFTQAEVNSSSKAKKVSLIDEYFLVQISEKKEYTTLDLSEQPFLKGYEVRKEGKYYRYYIGKTRSLKLVKEIKKSLVKKGVFDAKVVKFRNGVRKVYE